MYLPFALEVYNRLFNENLGFVAVDTIQLRNTIRVHSVKYSPWLFSPYPAGSVSTEGCGEYC